MINKLYAQLVPDASQLQLADKIALALVALAPLLMLSLRGWLNALLAAVFLLSVWHYAKKWRQGRNALAVLDFWDKMLLLCLSAPFLAIFFSQMLRGQWNDNPFDGPVRVLACFVIFLYLRSLRFNVVKTFGFILPISLWLLFLVVKSNSDLITQAGGRYTIYFGNPITLGQFSLVLAFLCLASMQYNDRKSLYLNLYQISGFVVGIVIALGSGSRGAWVAAPILTAIYVAASFKQKKISIYWWASGFLILGVVFLMYSDLFLGRLREAYIEIAQYLETGHKDTSLGLRFSFIKIAWHLWLESPLYGYGDGMTPKLADIPALSHLATPMVENTVRYNGVHNELMQNLLRSGIFGLLAYLAQLLIPLLLFFKSARSPNICVASAGILGLMYISSVFLFGLSVEVFNLKYTAFFYGFIVAALAAQCLSADPTVSPGKNHVS